MRAVGTEAKHTPQLEREILHALAENKMSVTLTARALCYHPGTIKYHIKRIREKTGKDPRHFYDLAELIGLARVGNNDPLTIEELRQMDGEPVWIVWPDGRIKPKWWVVGGSGWYLMEFFDPHHVKDYGEVWVAYRRKTEEG